MKPNPTKLAILISLLGLGLPWPEIALSENGSASASASSDMNSKDAAVRSALGLLEAPKPQTKVSRTAKKTASTKQTKRAPAPPPGQNTLDTIAWDKAALGLEAGVDPLSGRAVVGRQIESRRPVRDDQLAMIKVALGLGSYRPTATSIALLERRPLEGRASQIVIAVAKAMPAVADEPLRTKVDADGPLLESPKFKPGFRSRSLFDSNGAPGEPLRDQDESPPMLADELRGAARREQRWSPAPGLVTTFPSVDSWAAVEMQSATTTLKRGEEPGVVAGTLTSQFEVFTDDRKTDVGPIFGGAKAERDAEPSVPDFSLLSASAEPASPILIDVPVLVPESRPSQSILLLGTDKYGPNDSALHSTLDLFEQSALVARASPESPTAPGLAPDLSSLQTGSVMMDSKSISLKNNYYATRPFLTPDALLRAFAGELGANDIPRDVDARHKQESATGRPSIEQLDIEARDDLFAIEQERDIERILSGRNVDRMADSTEFAASAAERFPAADVPMVVLLMERLHLPANEARPSTSPETLTAIDINLDELDGFYYPLLPTLPSVAAAELRREEVPTVNKLGLETLYINLDELNGFQYPLLPRLTLDASAELHGEIPEIKQLMLTAVDINLDEFAGFQYPLLPRLEPVASAELLGEMATIDQFNALSAAKIGSKAGHAEVQSGADELVELPTASVWASAMWRGVEPSADATRNVSTLAESTMQSGRRYLDRPVSSMEALATEPAVKIETLPKTESAVVRAMAKLAADPVVKAEPVRASDSSIEEPATETALKIETYPEKESNVVRAMAKLAGNHVAQGGPVRTSDKLVQAPHVASPLLGLREGPAAVAITQAALAPMSSVAVDHTAQTDAKRSDSIAESDETRTKSFGRDLLALGDGKLDQMRGGFETDSGLKISFGIERAVYINGSLVTTTSLNVSDLSKLTAGQSQAAGLNGASLALVQNGAGNTFQPGQISSSNIGTVIQNTLNDQKIQGVTLINATVNSLEFLKGINLQSTIRNAITDSLRR